MVLQVLYHGTAMVLQVLYYAATIFQAAGFSGATQAAEVSLILGLFKLVSTSSSSTDTCSCWGHYKTGEE